MSETDDFQTVGNLRELLLKFGRQNATGTVTFQLNGGKTYAMTWLFGNPCHIQFGRYTGENALRKLLELPSDALSYKYRAHQDLPSSSDFHGGIEEVLANLGMLNTVEVDAVKAEEEAALQLRREREGWPSWPELVPLKLTPEELDVVATRDEAAGLPAVAYEEIKMVAVPRPRRQVHLDASMIDHPRFESKADIRVGEIIVREEEVSEADQARALEAAREINEALDRLPQEVLIIAAQKVVSEMATKSVEDNPEVAATPEASVEPEAVVEPEAKVEPEAEQNAAVKAEEAKAEEAKAEAARVVAGKVEAALAKAAKAAGATKIREAKAEAAVQAKTARAEAAKAKADKAKSVKAEAARAKAIRAEVAKAKAAKIATARTKAAIAKAAKLAAAKDVVEKDGLAGKEIEAMELISGGELQDGIPLDLVAIKDLLSKVTGEARWRGLSAEFIRMDDLLTILKAEQFNGYLTSRRGGASDDLNDQQGRLAIFQGRPLFWLWSYSWKGETPSDRGWLVSDAHAFLVAANLPGCLIDVLEADINQNDFFEVMIQGMKLEFREVPAEALNWSGIMDYATNLGAPGVIVLRGLNKTAFCYLRPGEELAAYTQKLTDALLEMEGARASFYIGNSASE